MALLRPPIVCSVEVPLANMNHIHFKYLNAIQDSTDSIKNPIEYINLKNTTKMLCTIKSLLAPARIAPKNPIQINGPKSFSKWGVVLTSVVLLQQL